MPTVTRILNFSSGPAVLPVPVLEQVQRDLIALPGVGMSVMEISHRSATFEGIIQKAEADIRALAGVPSTHKILFLQGGASLQFSMVPLNLLTAGATADYVMTGSWAEKAAKEARKVGPQRTKFVIQGLGAGAAAGLAFCILRQLLDRKLRYPPSVERVLGLKVLGVIPETRAWRRAGRKVKRRVAV